MQEVTTFPAPELALPDARPRSWHSQAIWSFLRLAAGTGFKAVVLFAITQAWVVQGYRVYGNCMEPNLKTGERLLGNKLAVVRGVRRGDVVVFRPPHKPDTAFVKRVVGLPGETVEIRNSRVYVNNRLLLEPYLQREWHDDRPAARVPANMVFVLGDNRDNSNDSRMWGELPIKNIQAKASFRYWPPDRVGWIR
jgi:signal peptidase I